MPEQPPEPPDLSVLAVSTLDRGSDHEGGVLSGFEVTGTEVPDVRIDTCVLDRVTVTDARVRSLDLRTVWWRDSRLTGAELLDGDWTDVVLERCVLAGVALSGTRMRRVVFRRCKLDAVTVRAARLEQVRFEDCLVRGLDLGSTRAADVSFTGSEVVELDLTKAFLDRVDLTAAVALHLARGVDGLRGAVVTPSQLVDLAPALAAHVGLSVQTPP